MNKEIVIVSQAPLTPQIARNTYFDQFVKNKYTVDFWDLSQLLHPGMKFVDEYNDEHVLKIFNCEELKQFVKLNGNKDKIYIFDFDPNEDNNSIFNIFLEYKCYCIRLDMYANTTVYEPLSKRIVSLFDIKNIVLLPWKLKNLKNRLFPKFKTNFKFNKILSSCVFSNRTDEINHPDYDEYILNQMPSPLTAPYFLFIDTNFGFHPDLKYIHKLTDSIDIRAYYLSLNNFFDFLESKYKIPVVIAGHPKLNLNDNRYGKRKVIKYQTLPLIRNASYVIAQVCNTFSWITLLDKPVALVSTDSYLKITPIKRSIIRLSNIFKIKNYNLDKIPFNRIEFKRISKDLRHEYIYQYLTSKNTEKLSNINILKNIFSSIY